MKQQLLTQAEMGTMLKSMRGVSVGGNLVIPFWSVNFLLVTIEGVLRMFPCADSNLELIFARVHVGAASEARANGRLDI